MAKRGNKVKGKGDGEGCAQLLLERPSWPKAVPYFLPTPPVEWRGSSPPSHCRRRLPVGREAQREHPHPHGGGLCRAPPPVRRRGIARPGLVAVDSRLP